MPAPPPNRSGCWSIRRFTPPAPAPRPPRRPRPGARRAPPDLLAPDALPVYAAGRGGQFTYHGPGQRIGYVMLDLAARGGDLRRYVHDLEEWIIRTLARFDVKGERRDGRIGIWVAHEGREDKIAALGVRV